MAPLEELYREVILDHYRNPRNREPLPDPDLTADGVNPLCGDEVTVELAMANGTVTGVSVRGHGCSISQASGSMMGQAIRGLDRDGVAALAGRFQALISGDDEVELDAERPGQMLGDLEALQGVRRYPVRVKCAALPWATLAEAMANGARVSTE
ncbi:MAG TPA: SUF system NifU family Fe-S cluster assembly protein [Acidimicrobiia bacterium]|jgi:nitrogen fixation NifU-like protein